MGELGRKTITIVEVDTDFCNLTYGSSPCTAALSADIPRKCYNTRKTCQDLDNIDLGTLTLRFGPNQSGLPKGQTIFPALQSVSSNPGELNLSGGDPRTSALGKRDRVTVQLLDFAYHDTLTDKYQAERISGAAQHSGVGYDPAAQGTFFSRFFARSPYYSGWALRVKRGYVGQALADMETEHYVIDEWTGPDASGRVTIIAKDILDLADSKKVVAPALSSGKLLAAIAAGDSSLTLTPTGVGDDTYPASGRVSVGREVMTFTRSGDVLTLTARGADGTTAAAHDEGDLVQICLRYEDQRPCDIIYDLLDAYAGVSTAFMDQAAWQGENDAWASGIFMTATIADPTGVAQLIGEICQHGFLVWWDRIAQEIRFQANRPLEPGETEYTLTDTASLIRGSEAVHRLQDQRITDVLFFHGVLDPTQSVTDGSNFRKAAAASDADNPYQDSRIRTIYSRWFGATGNDAAASIIAERLLARFQQTPVGVSGRLDVKDRDGVQLGAFARITTHALQDDAGFPLPSSMQITSVEYGAATISFRAETNILDGRFGFYMQDPLPDYSTATDEEKATGAFYMDEAIGVFADGTGPYTYF